jgi:ribosomal protein S6
LAKKIITVDDTGYYVLGTVSVNSGYSPDKLKQMYNLADTVLRNGDNFYVCMKLIDVDYEEIND